MAREAHRPREKRTGRAVRVIEVALAAVRIRWVDTDRRTWSRTEQFPKRFEFLGWEYLCYAGNEGKGAVFTSAKWVGDREEQEAKARVMVDQAFEQPAS